MNCMYFQKKKKGQEIHETKKHGSISANALVRQSVCLCVRILKCKCAVLLDNL